MFSIASGTSGIGSPALWLTTVVALLALLALDFVITRRPHEVGMREAVGWSVFYLMLPVLFAGYLWLAHGAGPTVEFATGWVLEKSLSVDNLFVFMLLLSAFAVPERLRQRVLLYGIVGALVLRAVFIALGAAILRAGAVAFLVFGLVLVVTAVKILRDALRGKQDAPDPRLTRWLRRVMPVTDDFHGPRMVVKQGGRRALTPFALVVAAVLVTDVVFAVDSVPAAYGVTEDPYLVFVVNALALLGLRALYFVLQHALSKLRYLNHGLALILAFIGVKLGLTWAHRTWPAVPEIPTLLSLGVVVVTLLVVTVLSLRANRRSLR